MRKGGFGGSKDFDQKVAPVSVGEEVEVAIEAVGAKGDGIAKKEGFVIFVPNTSKGDTVRIKITKVLANMAFAEVAGQAGSKKAAREEKGSEEQESVTSDAEPVDTENFGEEQ